MMMPDTEVMLALDRIEDRLRQSELRKRLEEAKEREQTTEEPTERGWFRQLFLGKAGA